MGREHFRRAAACSREREGRGLSGLRCGWNVLRAAYIGDDFEVIPIPGHTGGATAYLWDNGEHRFLFTRDTIYLRDGEWVAAVLPSSDREAYVESLELIRGLDFDVLVPWLAAADGSHHDFTDKADTERRIDAILQRVRHGDDR